MHLGMTGRFSVQLPARHNRRPSPSSPSWGDGGVGGRGRGTALITPTLPSAQGERDPDAGRTAGPRRTPEYQLGEFTHEHGDDAKHDHLVFTMSGGAVVTYNDARRFGYMTLVPESRARLDAGSFAGSASSRWATNSTRPIWPSGRGPSKVDLKALLMDQRIVAGLGNIYVCEALFRAGPRSLQAGATAGDQDRQADAGGRAAGGGDQGGARRCHPRRRLDLARLQAGGRSLGEFQHRFDVYGREGEPCRAGLPGHGARKTQGGRSTFYCPACQR